MSRGCKLFVLRGRYVHLHRLPFTFSALRQPCAETFREPFRRNAKTGLHSSFGDWQRVVKLHRIGKIPHAELIEPLQRASAPFPANHHIHFEFLGVHAAIIALRSIRLFSARTSLAAFRRPQCLKMSARA
jgi:hypothetical protein